MSKPALEHFVAVDLAVNFQQINRSSEGSRGFIAGRIELRRGLKFEKNSRKRCDSFEKKTSGLRPHPATLPCCRQLDSELDN